jgi:hypothetical protein
MAMVNWLIEYHAGIPDEANVNTNNEEAPVEDPTPHQREIPHIVCSISNLMQMTHAY